MNVKVKSLITAEELLKMGDIGRCELVKGEIIRMSPAGHVHGKIAMEIGRFLSNYVVENRLGVVYAAETGFIISRNPDTVRAPDAMFVSTERLSEISETDSLLSIAPDLAVEVISPSDPWTEVEEKLDEYFRAGVKLIWVLEPKTKRAYVYRSPTVVRILSESETLSGEEIVSGFEISVSKLFR